jgi:FkbM family methyltransferase
MKRAKINFIDVGCADVLIKPWRGKHYKDINFLLGFDISGLKEYSRKLSSKYISHKICKKLVSDKIYNKMFIYNKRQVSSLFEVDQRVMKEYIAAFSKDKKKTKERERKFKLIQIKDVKCVRIDDEIDKIGLNFDFIKIDTQGSEFQVIKSLGKYLDIQIIGIHVELLLKPIYKNAVLYDGVNKYLMDHGFYQAKKIGKSEWDCDFLYLRNCSMRKKKEKEKFIKKIYKIE